MEKTQYDFMRESEESEEDAYMPDEIFDKINKTTKEKYFEYYDDIKLTPKDDW